MFYDYYGFPPETYEVNYPAPGAPEAAHKIAEMLVAAGIPTQINPTRGYDHGHFIPLMIMYPEADIPTLQLSLIRGLNPERHLQLGEALRPLLEENVLISRFGILVSTIFQPSRGAPPKRQTLPIDAFHGFG